MALEIRCPGCGRTLRIGAEHAGKQVRCPACQLVSLAGGGDTAVSASGGEASGGEEAQWLLRTPEGQTYGPIAWSEVQQWAAEGRISADCKLGESGGNHWQEAGSLLPQLAPPPAKGPPPPMAYPWTPPISHPAAGGNSPFAAGAAGPAGAYVAPHRGGLILVLGLLGFIVNCPIFSLLAWVMGSRDLVEMRSGRMDPSGEGLTQAGRILGMILSLLWLVIGTVTLAVIMIVVVAAR